MIIFNEGKGPVNWAFIWEPTLKGFYFYILGKRFHRFWSSK